MKTKTLTSSQNQSQDLDNELALVQDLDNETLDLDSKKITKIPRFMYYFWAIYKITFFIKILYWTSFFFFFIYEKNIWKALNTKEV